ncbi:hypothetical protein B0H13DRAFT_1936029 [Mycena leptocephala]|nr:hypothetical protein B0H13DRAFT_1936029 [Mycena leptocephala]
MQREAGRQRLDVSDGSEKGSLRDQQRSRHATLLCVKNSLEEKQAAFSPTCSSTIAHAPSSRYKMRRGKNTKEKIQIQIRLAKTETRSKAHCARLRPEHHLVSKTNTQRAEKQATRVLERGEIGPVAEAGEFCSGLHFELDWMMKRGSGGKTTRTPCVHYDTPRNGAPNGNGICSQNAPTRRLSPHPLAPHSQKQWPTERMTRSAGAAPHEARRDGERWVDCLEPGGREGECEMWVGNKAGTYNAAKKASASKPSTPIR